MQQRMRQVRSMRIVFAASTAFHLRHLALELLERGWDVEFHSYLPRWKTRQYGLPDHATVSHFSALLPWSGLALLRGVPLQGLREWLFAKVDRRIARTMRSGEVFVGLSAIAVESAAKARGDGALVLIERGSSHIDYQRLVAAASGQAPPGAVYVAREHASYAAASRIVVPSRFALRTFVDNGTDPRRLELMPLGVDLARFASPAAAPVLPVRALYAGVWSRRKGCDQFAALLEAEPDLDLLHVGTVGDLPLLEHPRFKSVGHQPQARLAELMRDRHLFLFPSRDDGFGMVMAEALASGMHVVASDASGGPDLADMVGSEFVAVFPAGESAAFHAAVRGQIKAIAAAAAAGPIAVPPERFANLSWQAYGERYDAMLRRLLDARP